MKRLRLSPFAGTAPAGYRKRQRQRMGPNDASLPLYCRVECSAHRVFYLAVDFDGDDVIRAVGAVSDGLPGYSDMGVKDRIQKVIDNMTQLAALLRNREIAFSVAVYPWPDQLRYDTVES